MMKVLEFAKKVWADPVWSKVIAAGVISLIGAVVLYLSGLLQSAGQAMGSLIDWLLEPVVVGRWGVGTLLAYVLLDALIKAKRWRTRMQERRLGPTIDGSCELAILKAFQIHDTTQIGDSALRRFVGQLADSSVFDVDVALTNLKEAGLISYSGWGALAGGEADHFLTDAGKRIIREKYAEIRESSVISMKR